MCHTASIRKALLTAVILAAFPCVLLAQEHREEEAGSPNPSPELSVLHVEKESLLRVDLLGRVSWRRVEKGDVLEGRLSLPLYAGDRIAAPADSDIRVTVNSVERIREPLGFWRKAGRTIVRAFNPLETSHPAEFRVELSAADLLLPSGEVLPLDVRVLRAGSGVMVQPKIKSTNTADATHEKSKAIDTLLIGLRRETQFSVRQEQSSAVSTLAYQPHSARAYLLTPLRASLNHQGDSFQAQLAEPVSVGGRVFAPRTVVEGTVVRSVAPRMLSRAGRLYLRIDRIVPADGEPLRVSGSLSGAEADAQSRFALDEEGTLHGRKPGVVNGLVDLGYAYFLGKASDDISETPIRALGASMSDAAVANAARYVGLTTAAAFLVTRHGRDVYLPKYSLIEIDFGRANEAPAAGQD